MTCGVCSVISTTKQATIVSTKQATTVQTTTFQTTTDQKTTDQITTDQTLEATTKLKDTQLLAWNKRVYVDRVMARLENFNKIFESKVAKFNRTIDSSMTSLNIKPRIVFLMITDLQEIVKNSQKIADIYVARYERRQTRKRFVSTFKLTSTITLLGFGGFLVHTFFKMWRSMLFHYEKLKIAKEKRKQRRKQKRKCVLEDS